MASSITAGILETFFGLFSIVSLLCVGTVRGAPVSTVLLSTFLPTSSTEAGGAMLECGAQSTASSTSSPTSGYGQDYMRLLTWIDVLERNQETTFTDYKNDRFVGVSSTELNLMFGRNIEGLPDLSILTRTEPARPDLRLATHYFILKSFTVAMMNVGKDEGEYNGSRNFVSEFRTVENRLDTVQSGIRDLVCSRGFTRESEVGEMEVKFQSGVDERARSSRDYAVLYRLDQYLTKLQHDITILPQSRQG